MELYVDSNPKACAWVIRRGPAQIADSKLFGETAKTNNEAEYEGLSIALREILAAYPEDHIRVLMDSKLVINQLNSAWTIKKATLRERVIAIWNLIGHYPKARVTFTWVPRKENLAGKLLG